MNACLACAQQGTRPTQETTNGRAWEEGKKKKKVKIGARHFQEFCECG